MSSSPTRNAQIADNGGAALATPAADGDMDDDDEDNEGQISLAQVLLESRLPDLPPVGTRQPQQPILISASHPITHGDDEPSSPGPSETHNLSDGHQSTRSQQGRRRRWSLLIGNGSGPENVSDPVLHPSPSAPPSRDTRLASLRSSGSRYSRYRPSTAAGEPPPTTAVTVDSSSSLHTSRASRSSHFLTRLLSNAFQSKRSEDHLYSQFNEVENSKKANAQAAPNFPPPKLEYVKLPGTKGALMVKAVETQKKR